MVPGYKDLTWPGTYHVLWDHVKELQGHTDWGKYEVVVQYKVLGQDLTKEQKVEVLLAQVAGESEIRQVKTG